MKEDTGDYPAQVVWIHCRQPKTSAVVMARPRQGAPCGICFEALGTVRKHNVLIRSAQGVSKQLPCPDGCQVWLEGSKV